MSASRRATQTTAGLRFSLKITTIRVSLAKVDKTGAYREDISKVCALIEMTLRGTPYIYQGQELSMGNGDFDSIDQLNDREAVGIFKELVERARPQAKAFYSAKRERVTTPERLPLVRQRNAGFTTGKPWLKITTDYRRYNAADEAAKIPTAFSASIKRQSL